MFFLLEVRNGKIDYDFVKLNLLNLRLILNDPNNAATMISMSSLVIETFAVIYFMTLPHTAAAKTTQTVNEMPTKLRRKYWKIHELSLMHQNGFLLLGMLPIKQTTLIKVNKQRKAE